MKNLFYKSLLVSCLSLIAFNGHAEVRLERPNRGELNLPFDIDSAGKIKLILPSITNPLPDSAPRKLAECKIDDYSVRVVKEHGLKKAYIEKMKDGQPSKKVIPYVFVQKLNKEMLGQYAAAVDVAQQLGITQIDYIKIFLVEPNIQIQKSKALVFFYDADDEIIDRTIIGERFWIRCQD